MGEREVTCVVGPRVQILGRIGSVSSLVRWLGSGRRQMCTVCEVAIAKRFPLGDMISCLMSSATGVVRIWRCVGS